MHDLVNQRTGSGTPFNPAEAVTAAEAAEGLHGRVSEHLRAPWAEVSCDTRGDETALVALDGAGDPIRFLLVRDSPGLPFRRYLVVDADRRGQGLGAATWKGLTAYARGHAYALLVWDVEHPDEDGVSADRSCRWTTTRTRTRTSTGRTRSRCC